MKDKVIHLNSYQRAITGASLINPADVLRQLSIVSIAIDDLLLAGLRAEEAWASLADSSNVCESLARIGIGRGASADIVIAQAQEALAFVRQERLERGTYALTSDDRAEVRLRLELFRDLHRVQLSMCSYSEFERAYNMTRDRLAQARAGNAPVDAVVVYGSIGHHRP